MAETARTPQNETLKIAAVVIGATIALNIAFMFLSAMYFESKPKHVEGDINSVRGAFAMLTGITALASLGASLAPRVIGHGLAYALGVASVVGGAVALASPMPSVMGYTLKVAGVLTVILARRSWRGSRAAWSFLIAMLAVLATVTFFGAPKIRHVLDISLWHSLMIPSLQIVAVVALSTLRADFKR